jgi:hypothetical protein
MERTDILELMSALKLYGMRAAYDEVMTTGIKRRHEPARIVGDLLSAEIAEKQARSIKYQLTIAKWQVRTRQFESCAADYLAARAAHHPIPQLDPDLASICLGARGLRGPKPALKVLWHLSLPQALVAAVRTRSPRVL